MEASKEHVAELTALSGNRKAGEQLNARIDAALDAAQHKGAAIPALIWQSGGYVPGHDTLIANLLNHTGFAHFSALRGMGQADRLPWNKFWPTRHASF